MPFSKISIFYWNLIPKKSRGLSFSESPLCSENGFMWIS